MCQPGRVRAPLRGKRSRTGAGTAWFGSVCGCYSYCFCCRCGSVPYAPAPAIVVLPSLGGMRVKRDTAPVTPSILSRGGFPIPRLETRSRSDRPSDRPAICKMLGEESPQHRWSLNSPKGWLTTGPTKASARLQATDTEARDHLTLRSPLLHRNHEAAATPGQRVRFVLASLTISRRPSSKLRRSDSVNGMESLVTSRSCSSRSMRIDPG